MMISRRNLLQAGLVINGAVVVTPMATAKKGPDPQGFAPGQIWLDQWGRQRIILWQEKEGHLSGLWRHYSERHDCTSWVESGAWRYWRYSRSLSDLGGAHD